MTRDEVIALAKAVHLDAIMPFLSEDEIGLLMDFAAAIEARNVEIAEYRAFENELRGLLGDLPLHGYADAVRNLQENLKSTELRANANAEMFKGLQAELHATNNFASCAKLELERVQTERDILLKLLVDIRFAPGDDGKRMSDELVEYCRELRKDVERYRWLRDPERCESPGDFLNIGLLQMDAAIDAAMQTQAPHGA